MMVNLLMMTMLMMLILIKLMIEMTTSRRLVLSDDWRRFVRGLWLREQRLSLLPAFRRLRLRILFGVKFSLKQAHTYEVDFRTGYLINTYSNINILQLFINWGLCLEWIFLEASTHIKLIVEVGTTPYKEHSITLYLHSIKKTSVLRDGTSGKPCTSRGMWWTPGWE